MPNHLRDPIKVGPWRATLAAGVLAAVVQTSLLVASTADTGLTPSVRGLQILFSAGRMLALALVLTGVRAGLARLRWTEGPRGWFVLAALSLVLGSATLVEDLAGFAASLVPAAPQVALWALVTGVSAGLVAVAAIAHRLDRPRWRWLAVVGGLVGLIANPRVLPGGYPGAHLYLVLASIAAIAGSTSELALSRRMWNAVHRVVPWTLAAGLGLVALAIPPGHTTTLALLRPGGDVLTPYVTRLQRAAGSTEIELPPEWAPWFVDRREAPPVPPTRRVSRPDRPIVVFLTIDSMRADILDDPENRKRLPNLARLQAQSLNFSLARAPGSQTVYTIGQTFIGTYFSQQYWSKREGIRDLWPDDDETPRFPELLAAADIATGHFGTAQWLNNEVGLVRGFTTDEFIEPKKTRYSLSSETFPPLLQYLRDHRDGPTFIYTHVLDAHYRVSPAAKKKRGKARHLANLELVDAQIGSLVELIDELGVGARTLIIVSSDHGEGFGEHDTKHHRDTLYEELLRVPLFIHGPGVKARDVDVPVSVMDVGPTVLDVFRQDTPGYLMGQSLVPFFDGGSAKLTRPIAAEGRLKKAIVFPDGMKAIVDDRHHTAEVYDLVRDPDEAQNLLDSDPKRAERRIGTVRRFFEIHQIRRAGYEIPFRP